MYFKPSSGDTEIVAEREFLQKTTFKDKFEVVWNFRAPDILETHEKEDKTIADSIHWRTTGNNKYKNSRNKDYLSKSIEAYTKSIAFAPVGSSELSLAYANRSAALFKARLYQDCLLDIERAIKAGYPDHLKTKLFIRQSLCFKALNPNSRLEGCISNANAIQWLPDLLKSYPNYNLEGEYLKMMNQLEKPRDIIKFSPEIKNKNSIIAGGSDAIELKRINDNNQHIVATRDIKSGEFIYLSEPFATALCAELRFTNCWHCCRQTWAGIPCDQCPNVVFCSPKCKVSAWSEYHDIECLVLGELLKPNEIDLEYLLAIKILSKAINSAGGLIELKRKVDNVKDNDEMILTNGILDVNTIDNFNRLDYLKATSIDCSFEITITVVWIVTFFGKMTNIFGRKTSLKDLIKDKSKYQQILILGDLLLRYTMIVNRNAQFLQGEEKDLVWLHVNIPFCKLIKKSCDPNVYWVFSDSNVGFYASKPIKQGEPILLNVVSSYHLTTKVDRYTVIGLTNDDPVPCKCTACVENWPTIDFLPSFQSLRLPIRIKEEMSRIMLKLEVIKTILCNGDTRKLLTIKDSLHRMNDKIHQYITRPCIEKSKLHLALRGFYCKLLEVHHTLE
ncbi:SET and MYND domain-containing protein 4-like isoform X2 [Aphidius gifuensis]|uniref:SET and MYND domain-containing protein 4-like isoform X2 n=1 Tax=Aphidius gifuensis TaxID=684658 RepID=UPI001CDB70F9|nr:SET and MYND domain-containing protein 4-like isoform X2 [Aphidius gifuensis]